MISRLRRSSARVNDVDRAISRMISALPPTPVDPAMKALSTAANHSLLWFAVAALLASRKGVSRRAAARARWCPSPGPAPCRTR